MKEVEEFSKRDIIRISVDNKKKLHDIYSFPGVIITHMNQVLGKKADGEYK